MRPSFETIYMRLAFAMASRSTCQRLQVGCVITSPDARYIYGLGYNGGAAGQDNDCASLEPGQCGHLHAEENAIINCRAGRELQKHVFVTHLPCAMCAKRLVNLGGVVRVYYANDYRIHGSLDILKRAAIRAYQVQP